MKDFNESEEDIARSQLSEFARNLHEECQCQPVTIFPSLPGPSVRINTVELADGGLNLMLEERGLHFIAREDIGRNTFYRKRHDPLFIVPPWLMDKR